MSGGSHLHHVDQAFGYKSALTWCSSYQQAMSFNHWFLAYNPMIHKLLTLAFNSTDLFCIHWSSHLRNPYIDDINGTRIKNKGIIVFFKLLKNTCTHELVFQNLLLSVSFFIWKLLHWDDTGFESMTSHFVQQIVYHQSKIFKDQYTNWYRPTIYQYHSCLCVCAHTWFNVCTVWSF